MYGRASTNGAEADAPGKVLEPVDRKQTGGTDAERNAYRGKFRRLLGRER